MELWLRSYLVHYSPVDLLFVAYNRVKEVSDYKTTEDEIKSTVSAIEHELYKYYGETNNKYKSRYRSLMFNIKDPKNKVSVAH